MCMCYVGIWKLESVTKGGTKQDAIETQMRTEISAFG